MRLRVYVHRNLRMDVKDVTYSGENTGLMGVVANKGGSRPRSRTYTYMEYRTGAGFRRLRFR